MRSRPVPARRGKAVRIALVLGAVGLVMLAFGSSVALPGPSDPAGLAKDAARQAAPEAAVGAGLPTGSAGAAEAPPAADSALVRAPDPRRPHDPTRAASATDAAAFSQGPARSAPGPVVPARSAPGPAVPARSVPGPVVPARAESASERAEPAPARAESPVRAPESAPRTTASKPTGAEAARGEDTVAADVSAETPGADLEEGYFELAMERIPGRPVLVALIDPRGRVLIPLRPVAEQAGIPLRSAAGRIGLEWPAGIWETEVDPAEGTVRVGAEAPRPLPEGSWRSVNGELYLIASALESILDATVAVRWSDLMVLVTGTGRFPAARRVEREAERDRARGDSGYGPEPHATVPFLGRTSGASATWGVAMAESAGEIRGSARMALGGSVLGGGTEIGGTLGVGARKSSGGGDFFARFSRQVHGTEWLRRVELGSVLSGGTVSRSMVGATLTNEPHTQPRYFGDAAIRPSVPVGWEYEVYQGGNLVGVSGGEADSEVRAPLNYGNTPVTVRLIGPAGQEIVEDLLYVVSPRQIPSGRWRYDVGAGVCRDARCGNYGYGELRYGLLSWLTLGGGADRLVGMSTGEVDARAFGSLVMRPLPNLSTDLQLQPGAFLQANTRLLTSATGSVSASYTWNRPREGEVSWNGWQGQLSRTGRLPMSGSRTITARLLLRGRERDRVDSWRASVAAPVGGSFVMVDFESGLQVDRLVSARASTPLGAPRAWLADLAVHASASATARRIERMEAGTSFRPVPWGSLQAGIRIRPEEAPQLTLAFVTRSRAGFAQSRAVAGSRSSVSASMDGGVALREGLADPVLLPSRGIGHSGVHGVVFHDLNGNGIRDAGEPVAAGVTVGVQGRRTETDAKGRYRAWDVRPYEPVAIGVDSLTLDFGWTPGPREVVIRPSPNVFNRVDLALVRTREAVGRVEGPGGRRLGGVTVEVVDGDGVVVVTGRTYSDGELYLQRVPPGRFLVRAAESSTRALGLCGPPVEATLPFDGDHLLELPTLHLERRC